LCQFLRQEFQGHIATQTNILGFMNDTHASTAQAFEDTITLLCVCHDRSRSAGRNRR
jgi:hypothetical protein